MTNKEALEILRAHNEWRRDRSEIPAPLPWYSAKELGQAIDVAIKTLQRFEGAVSIKEIEVVNALNPDGTWVFNKKDIRTLKKHALYKVPHRKKQK